MSVGAAGASPPPCACVWAGTHLQVGPDLAAELVQDGALLRQHLVVRAAAVARAPRGVLQVLDRLEEVLLGQTHFGVRQYLIGT